MYQGTPGPAANGQYAMPQNDATSPTPPQPPRSPAPGGGLHGEKPTILAVSRRPGFDQGFMRAVLGVAERTRGEILVLSVDTMPRAHDEDPDGPAAPRPLFSREAVSGAAAFARLAAERGLAFRHELACGRVDQAVLGLCRRDLAVDFILLDADIAPARIRAVSTVPVFSLTSPNPGNTEGAPPDAAAFSIWNGPENVDPQGDSHMSERTRRPVGKTIAFGLAAAGLYALVFAFSEQIAEICGRGGLYAVVPVATVFLFSYVHGTFTGNFWSMLGIEASRKQRTTVKPSQPRQDRRPRATLQA